MGLYPDLVRIIHVSSSVWGQKLEFGILALEILVVTECPLPPSVIMAMGVVISVDGCGYPLGDKAATERLTFKRKL